MCEQVPVKPYFQKFPGLSRTFETSIETLQVSQISIPPEFDQLKTFDLFLSRAYAPQQIEELLSSPYTYTVFWQSGVNISCIFYRTNRGFSVFLVFAGRPEREKGPEKGLFFTRSRTIPLSGFFLIPGYQNGSHE